MGDVTPGSERMWRPPCSEEWVPVVDRTPDIERDVPAPTLGMLIYDPEFPGDRWRVTEDHHVYAAAQRVSDGIRTSWNQDSWERAWRRGWLVRA